MLLGMGELRGMRSSPATVEKFTEAATPPDQPVLRSLGWDIDSSYSSPRRAVSDRLLWPFGFTGTSIWIDPASKTYVILLTNYVHPKSGKNLSPSAPRISNHRRRGVGYERSGVNETGYNEALESSGARRMIAPNHGVLTGLDVLEEQKFAPLQGKRVGLITNQTGLDRRAAVTSTRCARRA